MSIFFNIGRNPTPDFVEINCEFITINNLKNLISRKIGVGQSDMKVKNVITNVEYAPNQYIKRGSSVCIDIAVKTEVDQPLRFHQIISNQKLESMLNDCRFYVVKSSNEDNIQKARDCSVWATTFPNQDKFKTAFQCFKNVFILFGTNRSYEMKGLARMESEPDKIPDKSIWSGVSNIRLGGNFKLRWIRKKPLSLATIEKKLGVEAKEEMLKATDGYEPDAEIAKKVALLFELPSEPYYKMEDLVQKKPEIKVDRLLGLNIMSKPNAMLSAQLASMMLKNLQQSSKIDQLGVIEEPEPQKLQEQSPRRQRLSAKKSKKSSKRRHKRHSKKSRRKHSSDSSSSSPSSDHSRSRSRSYSSSSSSSSSSLPAQKYKAKQANRATQKNL